MMARTVALVVMSGLALAGCAEQDILRYQDRPAQTAEECRAAYEAAKQRGSAASAGYSGGASALGASLGRGLAKGITESAYRNCLARVANMAPATGSDVTLVTPVETVYVGPKGGQNARARFDAEMRSRRIAPGSATCYEGAPLLYRGTLYCPKR